MEDPDWLIFSKIGKAKFIATREIVIEFVF